MSPKHNSSFLYVFRIIMRVESRTWQNRSHKDKQHLKAKKLHFYQNITITTQATIHYLIFSSIICNASKNLPMIQSTSRWRKFSNKGKHQLIALLLRSKNLKRSLSIWIWLFHRISCLRSRTASRKILTVTTTVRKYSHICVIMCNLAELSELSRSQTTWNSVR